MTGTETGPMVTVSETVDRKNVRENLEESKAEKRSKKFTCKQKVALVILAVVDFISYCSMSIMAPFYPQEAANKGMSESMAGFVFGFYALVIFISAPVFGKILPRVGLKFMFTGGVLMSGICSVIFGVLNLIDDYVLFTTFSFLIRGMEALGAAAYSTASYVTIVNVFPDHAGAVRGLLETFVGLGMSVGPAIGGALFAFGGFGLPFYVIGVIIILIAPLNIYLLPWPERMMQAESGSLTRLLKLTRILMSCAILALAAMTWSFLDPTLEPHLRQFELSVSQIGLIFLLVSATYGISSPIWGWLSDKLDSYWWIMTASLFLNSAALLVLGPSPILPIEDTIGTNLVSLGFVGVFVAMGLIPTYQALLDGALEAGFVENLGTHSLIAGLWSSVYSLGEVLGPVLGGTLLQNYGFAVTATVFSAINFIVGVLGTLYFLQRRSPKDGFKESLGVESYKNRSPEMAPIVLKIGKIM